ncbi:lipid-A-disaccharide kinase [Flavobacterium croceum DSM 17960]|uniref:Tetraacyldisaccharide 4'-kinase n=1 Tax=Flavobacterium croceum DSM 17960 TaxID=1121886 RepID=A0A2S4N6R9_9FLAO|nr:tetraacyldisaccharide 4'-kinase [Flavobacterium croceum]POS01381.1 lipid-A-disaccharide kinase [Flavobacterium croceum DSM 17960]
MNLLRKILFPFSILYGLITTIRNFLYDVQLKKSTSFSIPIIAVGNLSVGGTGKTPQIEYLIRLLSPHYKLATLSRGYKRKTKGFLVANSSTTLEMIGDEPFQIYKKFPQVTVAVEANRTLGIKNLINQYKPDVILLDDAFQHRKVKAGFYILLTAFDDLFVKDFVLPTGNLRETKPGAKRADVIIVTKCPNDLSDIVRQKYIEKIKPYSKKEASVFFTTIGYDNKLYSNIDDIEVQQIKHTNKVLVAGIAKPEPFFRYLQNENDEIMVFPDHHYFSEKECVTIKNKANNKPIVTTEKDYVRMPNNYFEKLYYLPIQSKFISGGDNFDKLIVDYVGKSSRNG